MSTVDFSSWPREQEAAFMVYEQRYVESQRKAWTIAIISAALVLVTLVGIYAGVEPDNKDMTKGMNMSNLTKKSAAPAPDKK